jgi:hypothetical protein
VTVSNGYGNGYGNRYGNGNYGRDVYRNHRPDPYGKRY